MPFHSIFCTSTVSEKSSFGPPNSVFLPCPGTKSLREIDILFFSCSLAPDLAIEAQPFGTFFIKGKVSANTSVPQKEVKVREYRQFIQGYNIFPAHLAFLSMLKFPPTLRSRLNKQAFHNPMRYTFNFAYSMSQAHTVFVPLLSREGGGRRDFATSHKSFEEWAIA